MAIDFPNSPSNGQVHTANGSYWKYNSTKGAWESYQQGGDASLPGSVLTDVSETVYAATGGALALTNGNVQTLTLTANTAISISGATANECSTLKLLVTLAGYVPSFGGAFTWRDGETPYFGNITRALLTFTTLDGGTEWLASFSGDF